ncbi:MAG: rod shape-determining protein MreC [Oscillospiraceae bacterium]|nr:rod shape-determining protein MreC [Oscillospiraceae bacterium]
MKALLTRKTIIIATIAVLIAIITIVSVNVYGSGGPITAFASTVSRPFRSMATTIARTFESIYSSIYRYDDLQKRYDQAISDIYRLQRAHRETTELLDENNRLRTLLEFKERHGGLILEEAIVQTMSSSNFVSSFTINKGYANSEKPIARGNSVITEYGVLIGRITEVNANTSTVISVLDTTFSAAAFVGEGDGSVTAKGDFALMSEGLLLLDHFDDDRIVLPGDTVITSGSGGIFPVGLVIGEVIDVLRHSTGVGRYATVRPMRAIDMTIVDVYIVVSFDATG